MKLIKAIASGFAGAIALNLLHESARRLNDHAPRIDLLGEEAVLKGAAELNLPIPNDDNLYDITLAGDIVSNTAYYSMIGLGGKKGLLLRATVLGLSAGLGAVKLPGAIGLHDEVVASTPRKSAMTVAYYLFGALVTAAAYRLIAKK